MNELLASILRRAEWKEGSIFGADEVARWPAGALQVLEELGLLRPIEPATSVLCQECPEGCWIDQFERRTDPRTGKEVGFAACLNQPDIGPILIDLERLRQWELHLDGLAGQLAKAIGTSRPPEQLVPGRLWSLGTVQLAGRPRLVLLAHGVRWPEWNSAVVKVSLDDPTHVVALVLGAQRHTILVGRRRIAAVPLAEVLSLHEDRLTVALEPLGLACSGRKQPGRRKSSVLTPAQTRAYELVHARGMTVRQAALELGCSKQNVSKLLREAELKIQASTSRNVSLRGAKALPTDKRGQPMVDQSDGG